MKIENHIQDILQLYEFGMNIGKSFNYKESCDTFLKLLLKRKNLNAAYILEYDNQFIKSTYAIPLGKNIKLPINDTIKNKLSSIHDSVLIKNTQEFVDVTPINIEKGSLAIFNMQNNSYLLLYTNKDNLTEKDLAKLKPVITKFSVSLEACRTFERQEKLLQNLKVQNQELNDYAQLLSHDLKTPIQSIEALTSWVIQDYAAVLGNDGKENLNLIKENVEKIDTLVKGVLDYSTIGKIQSEVYDVDLNTIVDSILEKFAKKRNIHFIKLNTLPTIKGRASKLKLLFKHLIENAIQFNDKEILEIEIGSEENEGFWKFYIKDNGKGIEKKYFDKIFMAFQKLDENSKSSGMGLPIVKKIIDIYQGEIWLKSTVNKGTIFYFSLKK